MSRLAATTLVLFVAAVPARAAAADDAPRPPAAADALRLPPATGTGGGTGAPPRAGASTPDPSPRVRASHRVDVIAPGERVDTILDRSRARVPASAAARDAPAGGAPPARASERRSLGATGDAERPGAALPAGGGERPEPSRGDTPPPERPRRR